MLGLKLNHVSKRGHSCEAIGSHWKGDPIELAAIGRIRLPVSTASRTYELSE